MIVTIWRHGMAEAGAIDRHRNLTPTGRDDVGFGCHQFHDACVSWGITAPTAIFYSPWVRTDQTAQIIAGAFSHAEASAAPALKPGSTVAAVDSFLGDCAASGGAEQHILLVSHQPLVSQLADHYVGEKGKVPPLTPGGYVALAMDAPAAACGRLLFWAMPPEFEACV
jgi:phosphohistidine phosphatase